jgi:hypothetical protein
MIGLLTIICLLVIIVFVNILYKRKFYDVSLQKSTLDNDFYLVKNTSDKQTSANILSELSNKIQRLNTYLYKNKDTDTMIRYKPYIIKLNSRLRKTIICENADTSKYTSYTINKGEKIAFCLHSKKYPYKFHDINLITYVALHEISHIACPEIGHTDLFKEIFAFITQIAIDIGIYRYENFKIYPKEYCGIDVNDSII